MAREYFCAYHSYLEAIEALTDAEKGRLFTACLIYSMTGEAQELCGNERFLFPLFRQQIDRDVEKFNAFTEKQTQNGKKGGRPKTQAFSEEPKETQKTQAFFEKPKKAKEKEKEKENKRPTVSKPPLAPLEQAVEDFKAHRSGLGKKMTPKAVDLMLKRLEEMAPGDDDRKIAILNQSIERGWLGVFDLKADGEQRAREYRGKPNKYKNSDFNSFFENLEIDLDAED